MGDSRKVLLKEIAHARSGDKGNHANIGVIAIDRNDFELIGQLLTVETVAEYFQSLKPTRIERFELPGIGAYNFLLHDALGGGASRSLRVDSQGKTLALALLEMEIELPE